jgi:uncharacterized protein involved in outer membrane biogenesis
MGIKAGKWLRRALWVLGIVLVLAVLVPLLVPLGKFIPEIERLASAKLGEPVKIAALRAYLLPAPHATASGIVVGKGEGLKIATLTVTPSLLTLASATRVIRVIEITGLDITQKALEQLAAVAHKAGDDGKSAPSAAAPPVRVNRIVLNDALLRLERGTIGPLDADLAMTATGEPESATLRTNDGNLKAFIKPIDGGKYAVEVTAKKWTLPAGPAIVFDELNLKGSATTSTASFDDVRAKLYGGTVSGGVSGSWAKGLAVRGQLEVNGVELGRLLPVVAPNVRLSGALEAKPLFSAQADSPERLAQALRLETPFNVRKGVLKGFDIVAAATSIIRKDQSGGETHFETLTGRAFVERGAYRLTQLNITSGSLNATGNVNVAANRSLSGRIDANVQVIGKSAVTVPLNVAGTMDLPLLYPTAGALAGGAIGTVILGPGVGTSAGVKAGQAVENFTDKLFGRNEKKR